METPAKQPDPRYEDMSATEFRQGFGRALEHVARGRRVRITRHGRTGERLVVLRESELRQLEADTAPPLDALRAEFDRLVADMQSPASRAAAASVGDASPASIAAAAARRHRRPASGD